MAQESKGKKQVKSTGPLEEIPSDEGREQAEQQEGSRGVGAGSAASGTTPAWLQPTVLTWQDIADLPRQILPEETYSHLKNARREAALALYSLWKSINSSRSSPAEKTRKRIEVE